MVCDSIPEMQRPGSLSARAVGTVVIAIIVLLVLLRSAMSVMAFTGARTAVLQQVTALEDFYRVLRSEHVDPASVTMVQEPDQTLLKTTAESIVAIGNGTLAARIAALAGVQRALGAIRDRRLELSASAQQDAHIAAVLKETGGRGVSSELIAEYNRRVSTLRLAGETISGRVLSWFFGTGGLGLLSTDGKQRDPTLFF